MVDFIKKVIFVAIMAGGLYLTYFSVENLERIYIETSSMFVQFGVILIFVFTIFIIIRYLLLMFFSILQTIKRSADEDFSISKKEVITWAQMTYLFMCGVNDAIDVIFYMPEKKEKE